MEVAAEKAKEYLECYKAVVQGRTIYVKEAPQPKFMKFDSGHMPAMKMTWENAKDYLEALEAYVTCLRKELDARTQLVTEVGQTIESVDSVLQELKKRKEPEATTTLSSPMISVVETPVLKKPAPQMLRK